MQKSCSENVLSKPCKDFIIDVQSQGKKKRYLKNARENIGPIIALLVLCMLVPSWDVYSDWAVTIRFFLAGYTRYGLAMMVPQILNMSFTFYIWSKLERGTSARYSWVLVIGQCWPQFCAARIICMIIRGEERWMQEKKIFDSRIGTLEPYTESLPAVLILTVVWVTEAKIKENEEDWPSETDDRTKLSYIIWVSAYVSSIMTASFGMIKFFKNGPVEFLPSTGKLDGYLTWKAFIVFLSVLFMFVSKGSLLAFMIRNRPSLKYLYSANSYGPDVGTHCPHLTLLYHDEHFQDYLFNLTESSSYEDIFRSKEIPALIWNKTSSVWFERINHQNITKLPDFKTPVCGNWENNSLVAPDIFLWFILNCLPSLILATLVLFVKFRCLEFIRLFFNTPQFLLSPGFSPYGFQKTKDGNLALSPSITCANCLVTLLGYCLSGLVTWDTIQDYHNSHRSHRLWMNLIPILFLLSCMLSVLVIYLLSIQSKEAEVQVNVEEPGEEEKSLLEMKIRPRLRSRSI